MEARVGQALRAGASMRPPLARSLPLSLPPFRRAMHSHHQHGPACSHSHSHAHTHAHVAPVPPAAAAAVSAVNAAAAAAAVGVASSSPSVASAASSSGRPLPPVLKPGEMPPGDHPSLPGWYQRPLPAGLIPFSSNRGRQLFKEAMNRGGMEGYFALAEQFQTQSTPSCQWQATEGNAGGR